MKNLLSTCLLAVLFIQLPAQTWYPFATPATTSPNTTIAAQRNGERFALISGNSGVKDSVYTKTSTTDWKGVAYGNFISAIYTNSGDLYLVENLSPFPQSISARVYMSTDNGATLTQMSGLGQEGFFVDHNGTIILPTQTGFKYSTNDGASFTDVTTPEFVYSAAISDSGHYFCSADSFKLLKSVNGGNSWTQMYPSGPNHGHYRYIQVFDDSFHYEATVSYFYGSVNGGQRIAIYPGSIFGTNTSKLTYTPDGHFYIQTSLGLYEASQWNNWSLLLDGDTTATAWFGKYQGSYAVTDTAIYAKTDSGFITNAVPMDTILPGIGQVDISLAISISPNPANSTISINGLNTNKLKQISIYNLQGEQIITTQNTTINVSDLAAGLYFIKAQQEGQVTFGRFLKE